MKTTFYFFSLVCIFLLVLSCEKENLQNNRENIESGNQRILSLFASMPENNNSTRIALTLEEKNVKLTWEDGDQLQLLFLQGETKVKQIVTVKNISTDRKKADFDIKLPESINEGLFDLYGVYGGGGLSDTDPALAVLPANPGTAGSLESVGERKDVMMAFSCKEINTQDIKVNVTFRHLGSLFCIILKNLSENSIENIGGAKLIAETGGWAYNNADGGALYDLVNEVFTGIETAGDYISLKSPVNSLLSGESASFWVWYPPLPDVNWPELSLVLNNSEGAVIVSSDNSKPERTAPADVGFSYYFYAVWTGTELQFTDNTFTPPPTIGDLTITGNLRHAEGGNGFIGMVYLRDGMVYYNEALESGAWSGEVSLGSGSDPRLAIDHNDNPHVVYTTTDGKIAYISRSGSTWSETINIESNNSGSCSRPDIAVDGNGYAHITYTDTEGNTGAYTDKPDIMYAVNSSGSFVKTLIYNGYYESYGGADAGADYYDKGSRITLDNIGNYFILAHQHDFWKWMSGADHNYRVRVKSLTAEGFAGATYKYDREDIYDITFDGTSVVALYKTGNNITTSQLSVNGNTISFINPQVVTPSFSNNFSNPATLLALPETRIIGGYSGSNLYTAINTAGQVYSDVTVKSDCIATVASPKSDSKIYVAYTGSDGVIKLKRIAL